MPALRILVACENWMPSIGIRYGDDPSDYLSPYFHRADIVDRLIEKYRPKK